MLRKTIVFFAALLIVSGAYATEAFAAASVKKLGSASVSSNTAKPVALLPKQPVSNSGSASLQAKAATVSATKDDSNVATSRLSGVNAIKTISSGQIRQIASGGETQIVPSGVSEEALRNVVNRVEVLENKNVVTGVELEGSDGNYVKDVTTNSDGSIVKVQKTNSIIAPVRTGSYNASAAEEGEIWLVK